MLSRFFKLEDGTYAAKSSANGLLINFLRAYKEDGNWKFSEKSYNVAHYKQFFKVSLLDLKEFKQKVAENELELNIKPDNDDNEVID